MIRDFATGITSTAKFVGIFDTWITSRNCLEWFTISFEMWYKKCFRPSKGNLFVVFEG